MANPLRTFQRLMLNTKAAVSTMASSAVRNMREVRAGKTSLGRAIINTVGNTVGATGYAVKDNAKSVLGRRGTAVARGIRSVGRDVSATLRTRQRGRVVKAAAQLIGGMSGVAKGTGAIVADSVQTAARNAVSSISNAGRSAVTNTLGRMHGAVRKAGGYAAVGLGGALGIGYGASMFSRRRQRDRDR